MFRNTLTKQIKKINKERFSETFNILKDLARFFTKEKDYTDQLASERASTQHEIDMQRVVKQAKDDATADRIERLKYMQDKSSSDIYKNYIKLNH